MGKNSNELLLHIKSRLDVLNCPYLEDGSEQWLAELLLHSSEARMRLLSWVLSTYDSSFDEILNNTLPVISTRIDSRQQKMLLTLNIMGACKIDDLELVRGTASQKKQLVFWDNLIDMLYTSQNGQPYNSGMQTADTSYFIKPARAPTVSEVFDNTCKFIDTLAREQEMSEVFSSEMHLFSPDMEAQIKADSVNQSIPSLDMLIATAEKMQMDLQDRIEQLQNLNNRLDFVEPTQGTVENYCRKIDLALNMFSQITDSYIHCYENDIETWCSKPKPVFSQIGQQVKSVNNILLSQQNLTDSLMSFNTSTSYLMNNLRDDLKISDNSLPKPEEIEKFRETAGILQQAIKRREKTLK